MANSILSGSLRNPTAGGGTNPMQMLQQFQQFRNQFQGDPRQMVNQMLQSGRINNAQLQNAMQMARQFQHFVK